MSQLAETQELVRSAPESISACKELFSKSYKCNQLKYAFNSLTNRERAMICFCGELKRSDSYRKFEDFDDLELQKIRKALQELKVITKRFDTNVGDVTKLKPSHFQA
ncbi:MAG: hypothetical protein JKY55_15595 [Aliivibrio sp.]|uniref:hypothetical protein n=1 Tax=Aliivibrio sp. TaxID=1872443 RepID=UPI001A3CDC29|nr:hypothetical protein [Aliivibrio sp.]